VRASERKHTVEDVDGDFGFLHRSETATHRRSPA
jgi:hypothetical protein